MPRGVLQEVVNELHRQRLADNLSRQFLVARPFPAHSGNSFVSETIDRIQSGRLHCREGSEENAHERGNRDAHNGR
jgi:hypothetical protein